MVVIVSELCLVSLKLEKTATLSYILLIVFGLVIGGLLIGLLITALSRAAGESSGQLLLALMPSVFLFAPFLQPVGAGVGIFLFIHFVRRLKRTSTTQRQRRALLLSAVLSIIPSIIVGGYIVHRLYRASVTN